MSAAAEVAEHLKEIGRLQSIREERSRLREKVEAMRAKITRAGSPHVWAALGEVLALLDEPGCE